MWDVLLLVTIAVLSLGVLSLSKWVERIISNGSDRS